MVPNCERCELFLFGFDSKGNGWGTPALDVNEGRAVVEIDTAKTKGLVALVQPPWEPDRGPVLQGTPTVALRYNRQVVGSEVTVERARTRTRASGCWAGTDARRHRFHVVVRRVRLADGEMSTLTFTRTTQAWTKPMTAAPHGRLRTIFAEPCTLP